MGMQRGGEGQVAGGPVESSERRARENEWNLEKTREERGEEMTEARWDSSNTAGYKGRHETEARSLSLTEMCVFLYLYI